MTTDDRIAIGRINLGAMAGVESGLATSWTLRGNVGVRVGELFYAAPLTTAAMRTSSDGVIRVSANGLVVIPALLFLKANVPAAAIAILVPQVLLNPTVDVPVIGKTLSVTVAGRTDWYAFSEGSKIYMEGSAGLRLRLGKLVLEGRYLYPIVQGYLDNQDPMIGVNIYYGGVR